MAITKKWFKVLDHKNRLPEGRVQTVIAGRKNLCLTHYKGKFSALDNKCPHQGGPLGEGTIENGMLRCPWHGWDFDPCTGQSPDGFDDGQEMFTVKEEDGAIFVQLEEEAPYKETVSGDGGFAQYMGELNTLVLYNMNIKHILLNNSELGKISKEQRASDVDVWQTQLSNPNFAKYAENCGALGIRVDKLEDLLPAMKRINEHKGPALLEIITDANLI